MPDNLEVVRKEGYLHITFSGAFSLAKTKHVVDAVLERCSEEGCSNVLFDCRPMTGEITILERFHVGEYLAMTMPDSLWIAMLGREDQMLPDKFFENVVRNRTLILGVFSFIDEAIEWLKQ